jgi:hypothetical protein
VATPFATGALVSGLAKKTRVQRVVPVWMPRVYGRKNVHVKNRRPRQDVDVSFAAVSRFEHGQCVATVVSRCEDIDGVYARHRRRLYRTYGSSQHSSFTLQCFKTGQSYFARRASDSSLLMNARMPRDKLDIQKRASEERKVGIFTLSSLNLFV